MSGSTVSSDVISSDKVEGTAVHDRKGNRLGSVYTPTP